MIQEAEWYQRGKECSPKETVAKIQAILEENGIQTEYHEFYNAFEECYSARLDVSDIPGSLFGTNGKGLGPEYCEASAYAEMMERLENRMFQAQPVWKDAMIRELYDCNPKKLYYVKGDYQPDCIVKLKKQLASTVEKCPAWLSPEILVDDILEKLGRDALDFAYEMDTYYSVRDHKLVEIPTQLLHWFVASNGMAAGNSLEEAIVQAMSEIFERYATMKFVKCEYRPPIIPNEYCARYPKIYKIIRKIEEDGRYQVILRDCSMGMKLPVVCGVIVDRQKQCFGIKFGAHPIMEVALERIFTECFQGYTLEQFASNNYPVYVNEELSQVNTFNLIKVGKGGFPVTAILSGEDYPFLEWEEPSRDNKGMAKQMLELAESMGSDVYISNRSYLGFPSVFIYASGLSEVIPVHIREMKIQLHAKKCMHAFKDMRSLSDREVKDLLVYANLKMGAIAENTVGNLSGRYVDPSGFPVSEHAAFFRAICQLQLGMLKEANAVFGKLADQFKDSDTPEAVWARAAQIYLSAELTGKSIEEIREILKAMCPTDLAEIIMDLFQDKQTILDKCYPLCRGRACRNCDHEACRYPMIFEFYKKLALLERKNPPDQKCFMELLK